MQDLITASRVAYGVHATSKKQLFNELASLMIKGVAELENVAPRDIVSPALERERLGSTGVGHGVALPHARVAGIEQVYAAFVRLKEPMDYEAIDERPVDLVAMIIAPENAGGAHLRALARLSRQLRRENTRARLRAAPDAQSIYIILSDDSATVAA
ncbi:MAG: PTS sugar transporter subunit IIA [Maricaulaceae bacterium]